MCIVDEATCSICGNIARDESEYCEHVRNGLKCREVNGKKCFEYNKGVRFFEVSLISPYSEAADPDAKIKQVLASKADVAFEDWIVEPEEEVSFGTPVETAVGQKGVIIGSQGDTVEVIVQGRKSPQLFDLSTLTINDSSKEVIQMAAKNEELVKTAQGETKEDYGMEHPIRGNPSTGRWGGDYGSPAEKFKQDFDRTEKDSDEVDTRGNQTSSMIERGDYLHRGTTSDKAEGPLPKKASLEDIEALAARQLESATEAMQYLMEARTKEAEKKSIFSKVKQALGLEKEAEDYGMDKPYKGNPTTGSDAGNYAEATAYQDAQADEAKKKSDETMKDIEKQKPYNYSNTPENIYEKLPKVAASADVEKIVTTLKEVFKDKGKIDEFVTTIKKLKEEDFDEVMKMVKDMKVEEDKEVDKVEKEMPKPPVMPKPAAPPAPKPMPPMAPKPAAPIAPAKPVMPGISSMSPMPPAKAAEVRAYARIAAVSKEMAKLAALGDWGNDDPVAHAKRMILQQATRDPRTDPVTIFWLASDIRNLDEAQMSKLASELYLDVPGLKTASIDYSKMTNQELVGAYKALQATGANAGTLNSVLTAMVNRGVKLSSTKTAVTTADALKFVYDGMKQGRPYAEMKKEADDKFDIVYQPKTTGSEPAAGPGGSFMPEPGNASGLGKKGPSDGRYIGEGGSSQPLLWGGETPARMNEREIGRSSSKVRTAAGELNDYDLTFGSNTKWNTETKKLSDSEETTQKKDFASELKEARKKELAARASIEVVGGKSLGQWVSDLKKKGAPAKSIRQFQHIWKSAIDDGKSESYAARAAIDTVPKEYLKEPTKVHGPGKSGPKTATFEGSLGDTTAPKAPSSSLAEGENREQETEFKAELKHVVGLKLGQRVKVVVGTGSESHLGEIADIGDNTIHVDYEGIRNRDQISLKEGKSKVFGDVRVYLRPDILTVKKGDWVGYGDGKKWNVYNFHKTAAKVAEVDLADVDPSQFVEDFKLESVNEVPAFFASKEYGEAVLDQMQLSDVGNTEEEETVENAAVGVGDQVTISDEWLPTGNETEELVHDITQLKNDQVPGVVEAMVGDELQVNFGGDRPILLTAAEIKLAKDPALIYGTDANMSEETKKVTDDANSELSKKKNKEMTASAFGPDSQRNSRMASKNPGPWEEQIQFMKAMIKEAGLTVREAIVPTVEAFEMDEGETDEFVGSDDYVNAFEMPLADVKIDAQTENKEATAVRLAYAGMKKKLCLRIAQDMAEKGMIDGLDSEAEDQVIAEAINAQAAQLLRMNDDGLYEFEKAVKSASDPDGVEALRKKASRVKPEEGTLQQPMIMRQSATGASRNSLDDPDFFR